VGRPAIEVSNVSILRHPASVWAANVYRKCNQPTSPQALWA
jgi:hypothetical protein